MKSNARPSSIYFSAYPLKAVEKTDKSSSPNQPSQSPYLKGILSGGKKNVSRARVFPMINPYKNPYQPKPALTAENTENSRVPEDIELTEKHWFHNYE